ncbi:MAG: hypothetical protein NUV97_01455 [archaeon]|nr:hypothetical protein [archaeon]MCR4323620.1 hypothetical protein [Nanoarchaeota archaeon]
MSAEEVKVAITAVNPEMYYSKGGSDLSKFKKLVDSEGVEGILKKYKEDKQKDGGYTFPANSIANYKIHFDSQQSQLEPIYYWLLDFVQDAGWTMEKLTDNFVSSPGSGHFSEMGQKVALMQDKGIKILADVNTVIKSVLNLIYDLKEFEIRLEHYDDAKSKDPKKRESGILALKQIWLDNVDMKRGRGAIHQLATMEMGYTTLREAFMVANNQKDLENMKSEKGGAVINDQVYRILVPRLSEFLKWMDYSEKEMRKRFSIEKSYLKSQIETIKLYSSWMKPYLKAAEELRQKGFDGNAALVNAFSTSMFELTLFGKKEVKPDPKFGDYKLKRKYYQCIVINLKYRGHVSQRVTQKGDYGFAMGGRVDMDFDAYSLNEEEVKIIMDKLKNQDALDSLKFSGDVAAEALEELREDLEHFLEKKEDKEEKKKAEDDINPFTALFGLFKKKEKKSDGKKKNIIDIKNVKKDNFVEKSVRADAALAASDWLYNVYDIYKKAHGMASSAEPFENADEEKTKEPNV